MMKKLLGSVLAIILLLAVTMVKPASAYMFDAMGYVDPNLGTKTSGIDADTGKSYTEFSEVRYTFKVITGEGDGGMNHLNLEFLMDDSSTFGTLEGAFRSAGEVDASSVVPDDWSIFIDNTAGTLTIASNVDSGGNLIGSPITAGGSLSFVMQNVQVWDDALLAGSGFWGMGNDVWEQNWSAEDTEEEIDLGGGFTFNPSAVSGSTAPAVPEPATMLLLGSGLIGLFGINKKKLYKGGVR